jgi:2-oxoglutarate/2-oxoacid ferredoxin oxidoreductase subunit beta
MPYSDDFSNGTPTWCPGCGDWSIYLAVKKALIAKGLTPSDVLVSFDIGCSGNMNDYLNAYAIHGLHGRSVPSAVGAKIANPNLQVFVVGGDGGSYGEGGNHFLHACRGNHDVKMFVHDNNVYGLTTGQVAPTAETGYVSKSTPAGIIEQPVNPMALAISQGATFVAQSFAGNMEHLQKTLIQAIEHKGFALVNILQPCVTFNKVDTFSYYMEKTYRLPEDYDPTNYNLAMEKAAEILYEKFPLGVLYNIQRPIFHEQLVGLPKDTALVYRERFTAFDSIMKGFM